MPNQRQAWALARVVVRRAMIGYYDTLSEHTAARGSSLDDENAGATLVRFATSDSFQRQSDLLELNDYLDALEQACGRTARLIAQNLIEPFGDCAARLSIEVQHKQAERVRQRRARVRRPRIRFSQRAVREAMALDKRTFTETMEQVRGFTRTWLTKTA